MTPEAVGEIPGIGEKTLGRRSRLRCATTSASTKRARAGLNPPHGDEAANEWGTRCGGFARQARDEKTPIGDSGGGCGRGRRGRGGPRLSTEAIADAEETESESDAVSEADAREETIELENDAVDSLVNESQEASDEGIGPRMGTNVV